MEQSNAPVVEKKRPTFLTVLCILTFVGCAISLYTSFKNYSDAHLMAANGMGKVSTMIDSAAGKAGVDDSINSATVEGVKNLATSLLGDMDWGKIATGYMIIGILNLLVLGGALLMWRMKKMGFFVYAAAEIAQVVVLFMSVGGAIGGIMGIVSGVFAAIFIILYAVNLKHLS